jgi:SAM domain (Sterile alpha motif)/Adenylate and Guanylate cyclase catalytic domain
MDVTAWLRGLGLERYDQAFRDNEIDEKVLSGLTAEDLKDLGVTLVGHRRRLLDAIAARDAAVATAAASATVKGARPDTLVQGDAERRQLTVMFCDLVGSTALSARLDPEDMREVIGTYHRCCTKVIGPSGGFVAKYMGDGVLAYSAIRGSTMPSGRCGPGWCSLTRLRGSTPQPRCRCRCGSGSPLGSSWSAI